MLTNWRSLHLFTKYRNQSSETGFTLIELLVVIIIIGILSSIAFPAFLSQAAKARQSEAKTNLSAVVRAQQGVYLESQRFTATIDELYIGVNTSTQNYVFGNDEATPTEGDVEPVPDMAIANGTPLTAASFTGNHALRSYAALYAVSNDQESLRNYAGIVALVQTSTGDILTVTTICEGIQAGDLVAIAYDKSEGITCIDEDTPMTSIRTSAPSGSVNSRNL